MDFEPNKNEYIRGVNPQEPEQIGWFESVGTRYKSNMLTDTTYSSHFNYLDVLEDNLGEDIKMFGNYNIETFREYDELINSGRVAFNEDGEQVKGRFRYDLSLWNTLKNKGFTPDSFDDEVSYKARGKHDKYEAELQEYDDTNWWGASGSADFVAGFGSYLSDPIRLASLVGEVALFKGSSPIIRENIKWLYKMKKARTTSGPNKFRDFKEFDEKGIDEVFGVYNKAIRRKGAKIEHISDALVNAAKKKKYSPEANSLILGMHKKSRLKEIGIVGGVTGVVGILTEIAFQAETFEHKTYILPEYGKGARNVDIALGGVLGFVAGGTFNIAANLKRRLDPNSLAGLEMTAEGIDQAVGQAGRGENINITDIYTADIIDEAPEVFIPNDINMEQVHKDLEVSPEFQPVKEEFNKEIEYYNAVKECIGL